MIEILTWAIYLCSLYFAVFWLLVLLENRGRMVSEKVVKKWPFVSIVVPVYNEERMIGKCIKSLLNLDYPRDRREIIAVNDASTDRTREICESFGRKIKLINLKKNSGRKAVPVNIGIRSARGTIIACLDADSVVDKNALRTMVPHFNDEGIAAVTPSMKVFRPKNLLQRFQWFEYVFAILLRKLMQFLDSVYVTPGPFSLYRKDVIEKLGYFDENNRTEDMEIALRLQKNNYRIKHALDAVVYTDVPSTMDSFYSQRRRWYQGLLYNSWKYRRIFFNRDYGDFGLFMMPMNLISAGFVITSALIFTYYIVKPLFDRIYRMFLVGFDVGVYFNNLVPSILLLDFDFTKLFVGWAVIASGIAIIWISHRYAGERMKKFGLSSLLMFVIFYFVLIGYVWVIILAELSRGFKRNW